MAGSMTGRLLSNRYIVAERIGVGGMAEVYQGQDNVLGRSVAIKIMLPQYAADETFTIRFKQEAAAAANLSSPYIVNVYDWGQDRGTYFIVMEYVRGSDLKTAIKQRGAINQRKVAEIGSQVCQALSVAHNQDIIHRDIKPQNIMIQPDGNVKVMDFGIARAKNSVMAKTSSVLGTAHYISPEQAQGKDLTAASDIYSLGVVLYEAATGELPFDGPDAVSVALKQVNEEPVPPREINPDIDPALEAIIMKALSKDPNQRFITARAMRAALNDFVAGRPVSFAGFNDERTAAIGGTVIPNVDPVYPPTGPIEKTTVMPRGRDEQQIAGAVNKPRTKYSGGTGSTGSIDIVKNRKIIPIVAAIVAVLAILGLAAFFLFGGGGGDVSVPDVVGKTSEEATKDIEDAGLKAVIKYDYSDKVEEGRVISQNPKAQKKAASGSEVTITVSQGTEMVEVPDLTDKTAFEARSILQEKGLKYEAGAAEHSDDVEENHVARQEPAAGTKVAKGTTITYYLSAGAEGTKVPDVVGELEGAAQAQLENEGFKVTVDYVSSNSVSEGHVISQSPSAGEKAKSGSTVNIVVSTGSTYHNVSGYVNDTDGGSIDPSYTSVQDGGSVTFYVNVYDGYTVSSIWDSNGNGYYLTGGMFTVSDITDDLSVSVTFEHVGGGDEPEPSGDGEGSEGGEGE